MAREGSSPSAPLREAAEADLLARLRAGDEKAFEELVRLLGGRLLAVARRFLPEEEDARDAVQDAFLSAFRGLARFEGQARLSTWLHRIVVNACLLKLRSRRRRPEEPIDGLLPEFLADGHYALPAVAWRNDVIAALERDELRALVREALERLPGSHRLVLLLRDIEGLDTTETAQALGISPANVKVRVHRARQALRTLLDARFREEEP